MSMTDRAQGVLYGQVVGDSLGSLVEFASPDTIAADYPGGSLPTAGRFGSAQASPRTIPKWPSPWPAPS